MIASTLSGICDQPQRGCGKSLEALVQSQTYFSSHSISCLRNNARNSSFGDAAEIRVKRVTRGSVAQERAAVFGGENEMNVNGGKGLWHGKRMPNQNPLASVNVIQGETAARCARKQSQRDCDLQPKVGVPAPTLGHRSSSHQPQRGCGHAVSARRDFRHNRVAVEYVRGTITQGSAFRPTLCGGIPLGFSDSSLGCLPC